MIPSSALVYGAIVVIVCLFQVALVLGAPWGRLTQGGKHEGPLPLPNRAAAGISILILAFMACAILSAAGYPPHWPHGDDGTGPATVTDLLKALRISRR